MVSKKVDTRWNTLLHTLMSIVENHELVKRVKLDGENDDKTVLPLTRDEIAEVRNLIRISEPYEAATKTFSGDTYVTISSTIPIATGIVRYIDNLSTEITTPLARVFLGRIKTIS